MNRDDVLKIYNRWDRKLPASAYSDITKLAGSLLRAIDIIELVAAGNTEYDRLSQLAKEYLGQ